MFIGVHNDTKEDIITADMARIYTRVSDVYDAVLLLMASYYVAHFTFPKVYVNLLSILQHFVVSEAYSSERSSNSITFLKKYADHM